LTFAWLIGFVSTTLGISIGGGIAWFLKGFHKSIATIYALCGGLIIGLLSFEILPEAIHLGDWIIFTLGLASGIILFELIHIAFHKNKSITGNQEKDLYLHTGLLLTLGISLHNLPMGVVLGTTTHSLQGMSSLLSVLILHNIPEGIILFTPLFMVGIGFYRFLFVSIIVAVPVAVGALFGSFFGMENPLIIAFFISLTIGTILMITVKEVFTESIKRSSVLYCLIIALMGSALIGIYFNFI
jgi:ZIP family zinc transporter